VTNFVHSTYSLDLQTGGVIEAVHRLNDELLKALKTSRISKKPTFSKDEYVIAHGLWQWPSYQAWKNFKKTGVPYIVFPHGMLDPWFKKTYPFKHLKKQCYFLHQLSQFLYIFLG